MRVENFPSEKLNTSIIDNHEQGNVGEFLRENLQNNAKLPVVSAFSTIYAYDDLREELKKIKSLRFLFGDPKFTQTFDPSKASKFQKKAKGNDFFCPRRNGRIKQTTCNKPRIQGIIEGQLV